MHFTRPDEIRPDPIGGIGDPYLALSECSAPMSKDEQAEANRRWEMMHNHAACEIDMLARFKGMPEAVYVLGQLHVLKDKHSWYFGELDCLRPMDDKSLKSMRYLWTILGELVDAGQLEVAFFVSDCLGLQRNMFERPWATDRKAIIDENGGSHTAEEWERLKDCHGRRCLRCGRNEPDITLTKDHVVPITMGGSDHISNLQPLCFSCNASKNASIADYRPAE